MTGFSSVEASGMAVHLDQSLLYSCCFLKLVCKKSKGNVFIFCFCCQILKKKNKDSFKKHQKIKGVGGLLLFIITGKYEQRRRTKILKNDHHHIHNPGNKFHILKMNEIMT